MAALLLDLSVFFIAVIVFHFLIPQKYAQQGFRSVLLVESGYSLVKMGGFRAENFSTKVFEKTAFFAPGGAECLTYQTFWHIF